MVYKIDNPAFKLCRDISDRATIDGTRIWSVLGTGYTRNTDDYGETYTEVKNNLPVVSYDYYVHMTKGGTMIVSKNAEVFRAKSPYTNFTRVKGLSTTVSIVRTWGFTEDNDGILYMTEYGNYPNGSGGYVNIIYWYKSLDDGLTWTKYDNLYATDSKHLHLLKVNPFTNTLYATTGDGNKLLLKSLDKGETWIEVIPVDYPLKNENNIKYGGFTGVGFFETGEIIWGTDWEPRDPVTGNSWNWLVRSNGDDVSSFVYKKMEKQYYGMCAEIVTNPKTGEGWTSLRDEFVEDEVKPVLMYTDDKGVTWRPLIELPAIGEYDSGIVLGTTANFVSDIPYIFWVVNNYGVVRIPKSLKPEIINPSGSVRYASVYVNDGGKIKKIRAVKNNNGLIDFDDMFIKE